jgi:succinate-acetate transporter protein
MNKVLSVTLFLVIFVFVFDVVAAFDHRWGEVLSGVFSFASAALASYLALLDLVNEAWQRPILPLFPHKDHKDDFNSSHNYIPKPHFHKSALAQVSSL